MREAIEQLYRDNFEMYTKSLMGRAGGLANAEDIVQEAFYRALKYNDSYDPARVDLNSWFSTILKRAMYDFKRAELKQGMATDKESREEPTVDTDGFEQKVAEDLLEEIEGRKPNHQNILHLFFIKNYAPRDITEVLNENISNVKKVLDRFKLEMQLKYQEGRHAEED